MSRNRLLMEALNALPDDLIQVVFDVEASVKSPLGLITTSVLSSLSSAVQGYIDIETIYGATQPVSIFSLVIANSGERKSSTERLVSKPLYELEAEAQEATNSLKADIKVDKILWKAAVKRVENKLRRIDPQARSEIEEIRKSLTDLLDSEPGAISTTRTIINDLTPAALFRDMAGDGKAVTLASSDAGNLFTRTNLDLISNVNQIWDGEDVIIARKGGDQAIINGRLTLSLMLQPQVLKRISDRKDGLLRESGYLARMLITMPESTMGTRVHTGAKRENAYLGRFPFVHTVF